MNKRLQLYVATMLALLLGMAAAQAPAETEALPYLTEEVTFTNEDIVLAGTLTLPEGEGPHPAIILVHGSGPNTRDQDVFGFRMFEVLADHLARAGIATLRYDKRGAGDSTGEYDTATSADFAADAEAGLRYLLERQEIQPESVGLLGHSEGGMIAPMIAARNPDAAFVIAMAPPVADPLEGLVRQQERTMQAAGADEATVRETVEQVRRILELTRAEDWEALEELLRDTISEQLQALPEEQRQAMGELDDLVAEVMVQYRHWFRFFLQYDVMEDWARLTVPVLALFGELDTQTAAELHRPALEEALAQAETDDVTIVVLETANHLFQDAVTGGPQEYTMLDPSFAPGFLETVTDWLLAHTAP